MNYKYPHVHENTRIGTTLIILTSILVNLPYIGASILQVCVNFLNQVDFRDTTSHISCTNSILWWHDIRCLNIIIYNTNAHNNKKKKFILVLQKSQLSCTLYVGIPAGMEPFRGPGPISLTPLTWTNFPQARDLAVRV